MFNVAVEGFVRVTHGKGFLTENLWAAYQLHPESLMFCSLPAGPVISLNTCLGVGVCLELYWSHNCFC